MIEKQKNTHSAEYYFGEKFEYSKVEIIGFSFLFMDWITRYKSDRMLKIWRDEEKYKIWRDIESAILEGWANLGVVPPKVPEEIKKVEIKPEEVKEEEFKTRHEVTAFVRVIEKKVSEGARRFVHLGVTSSDIMDTAFSIQCLKSCDFIIQGVQDVEDVLKDLSERYRSFIAVGRTHGVHAEPTTLGMKFLSHYAEFRRVRKTLLFARENMRFGKISGAVGIYSTVPPEVEEYALAKFGLKPEPVPTQVVPRDRYALFVLGCSLLASAIERLALNIRISQMTEISEMMEPFQEEQMGSSVMPHKRNPVLSENLTGISRVIRSTCIPVLENIPLLMERDISHSSAERVLFPQMCVLSDFALMRLKLLLEGLKIDENKVRENLEISKDMILSSRALFEMVLSGYDREKAYKIIQKASFSVVEGKFPDFKSALISMLEKEDRKMAQIISERLKSVKLQYVDFIFDKALSLPIEIQVRKKEDVFDPEGKTIAEKLRKIGVAVKDVRVAKSYIVKPGGQINGELFDFFVNPVVEDYTVELKE